MKEYINKLVELASIFVKLADGNNVDYSDNEINVYFTSEGEPQVIFYRLVEITFWNNRFDNCTEFVIKDISRLDEIPSAIGKATDFVDDIKNTIKTSHNEQQFG